MAAADQLVATPVRAGSRPPSRRRHWAARSRAARRASPRGAPRAAAPAPPKAISVWAPMVVPRSTACTRAALAMFSLDDLVHRVGADIGPDRPSGSPICCSSARSRQLAAASGMVPPANAAGSIMPERHVGVGDGRQRCRRGRSRPGPAPRPRSPGPPVTRFSASTLRDRAAAGADLHHLDHRDAHRQAAALQEARGAVDLERARGMRLDSRRSGRSWRWCRPCRRRARWLSPARAATCGREDRAAGRARFDQPHRKLARRLDRGQAAARGDEIERAAEALRPSAPPACGPDSRPSTAARRRWRRWCWCARTRASPGTPRSTSVTHRPGISSCRISRGAPLVRRD